MKRLKDSDRTPAHLFCWRRKLFDLLIKHLLHPLAHSRDLMVWAIKCRTVREDDANVRDELLRIEITRIFGIRVRLLRIRRRKLAINSLEVHGILYDRIVMGYIESNSIDGQKEGSSVLQFSKRSDSRDTEAELGSTECGTSFGLRRWSGRTAVKYGSGRWLGRGSGCSCGCTGLNNRFDCGHRGRCSLCGSCGRDARRKRLNNNESIEVSMLWHERLTRMRT